MGIAIPNFGLRTLADLGAFTPQQAVQGMQQTFMPQTLADIAKFAQQRDYQGAASAAFTGGAPDIAEKLLGASDDQRDKIAQTASSFAQSASTPQAWQNADRALKSMYGPNASMGPFENRATMVAGGLTGEQQIQNEQKARDLAIAQQNADTDRQRVQAMTTMLTPDALSLAASQYLAGDKSAATGYARNPVTRAQIMNEVARQASLQGMDGPAIAAQISAFGGNQAAQRAAGTRAAQVGIASNEADKMADLALTASANMPRGSFVPWNRAMQAVQSHTSSPELAKFVTATTSLVNAYARAVTPVGAPTDSTRAHAFEMLSTAQSPEAYAASIQQMKQEMKAALEAPADVSESLKANVTGGGDSGAPADPLGIR